MAKLKFRTCKNNTNLAGATTHMKDSVRGKKIAVWLHFEINSDRKVRMFSQKHIT